MLTNYSTICDVTYEAGYEDNIHFGYLLKFSSTFKLIQLYNNALCVQ